MSHPIFITGAAGFIGSHLTLSLLNAGYEVVGIDNFNDYYDPSLKEARWSRLTAFPGFIGKRMDLCDRDGLEQLFGQYSPELVCNLAAQAGVRYSIQNPFAYQESNLDGFLNILEMCRHHKVKRLVYASSSSVYGGNTKLPFSEDDPVDHPVSLYAATKKANELMAHTYSHLYGLQTIGLRFFTVYGPWGRPDMAYWLFCDAIRAGRPIKVFNHGQMRRDFTYIDDIVKGLKGVLFTADLPQYLIMNLGNHHCEELGYLIELIETNMGQKAQKEMLPMQAGDVPATWADISRAQKLINFEPETSLKEGIANFVAWYKDYFKM